MHIKLGLIKNFVRALDRDGAAFEYLRTLFSKLSEAKIKAGIFVGPQIRKLMEKDSFELYLKESELKTWKAFKTFMKNFLGNTKSPTYKNIVDDLLTYKAMGCNMSVKIHYLHSHLDSFPSNLGDVTDEHGERFHQILQP